MPASRAAAPVVVPPFPENADPHVAAMDRQTAAINRLVAQIGPLADALVAVDGEGNTVVERFAKAADELRDLGGAQKKLCAFIIKNRLKIAASVPVVLTIVGAVSPNVAHMIGQLLKVWGVQ